MSLMQSKFRSAVQHIGRYYEKYVVVCIVLLLVCGVGYAVFFGSLKEEVFIEQVSKFPVTTQTILLPSSPNFLRIPKINLSTSFEEALGVDVDGAIEVPDGFEKVGWYKFSPTPGELGPSVILGHVSSVHGPAVFYNLKQLIVGDEVYVDREDGTTATFVVTEVEKLLQSEFPTEKVYGNIDFAGLRLVTCAGTYNTGIKRFTHNLIVYAELKK